MNDGSANYSPGGCLREFVCSVFLVGLVAGLGLYALVYLVAGLARWVR